MNELERNLKIYAESINRDHQTNLVRRGFSLYAWFWFHTQFWLPPLDRRPYTFIMRDWLYTHLRLYLLLVAAWYAGLFVLNQWRPYLALILGIFSSLLLAHLCWGSGWKKGEQEWPPFLGGKGRYFPGFSLQMFSLEGYHKGQPCVLRPDIICQETGCPECWLWVERENK